MQFGQTELLDWVEGEIIAPEVEHRESLLELAKMRHSWEYMEGMMGSVEVAEKRPEVTISTVEVVATKEIQRQDGDDTEKASPSLDVPIAG